MKVSDSGCGMNENLVKNLFDLFQNLKFKGSINQHGIGLGLTICKKIVDSLHGKISCKSQLGSGTTMSVVIPINIIDI